VSDTTKNVGNAAGNTMGGATQGIQDTAAGATDKAKDSFGGKQQTGGNPLGL